MIVVRSVSTKVVVIVGVGRIGSIIKRVSSVIIVFGRVTAMIVAVAVGNGIIVRGVAIERRISSKMVVVIRIDVLTVQWSGVVAVHHATHRSAFIIISLPHLPRFLCFRMHSKDEKIDRGESDRER